MKSAYLLDTHVLLWLDSDLVRIPRSVVAALDAADLVYYSAASAWELSIKQSIGKIRLGQPISSFAVQSGFLELHITTEYAEAAAHLPLHHRDPFDRMLIAQAQTENMTLVTADRQFSSYSLKTLFV